MTPPPGFEMVREGRLSLCVRSDLREWMLPLLRAAAGGLAGYATRDLTGGRGGVRAVSVASHEVVVRPYRRGGVPARFLRDTYIGWRPRPFRELYVTETLRQRGAPVAEVYGAAVQWLMPGGYKGWLVTRYVDGARTFWECVQAAPPERDAVLRRIGAAIRCLHDRGGIHRDLNMSNILVSGAARAPDVVFIDFDRGGVGARPLPQPDALARLRRSARKLDPHGQWISDADLDRVDAAYWGRHA